MVAFQFRHRFSYDNVTEVLIPQNDDLFLSGVVLVVVVGLKGVEELVIVFAGLLGERGRESGEERDCLEIMILIW